MQNPVYQDQQENSKMEKIQKKTRIFRRICLGFLPASFEKLENPPTPSIDLKRKQEEKNLLSEIHSDSYMKDFGAMALS